MSMRSTNIVERESLSCNNVCVLATATSTLELKLRTESVCYRQNFSLHHTTDLLMNVHAAQSRQGNSVIKIDKCNDNNIFYY